MNLYRDILGKRNYQTDSPRDGGILAACWEWCGFQTVCEDEVIRVCPTCGRELALFACLRFGGAKVSYSAQYDLLYFANRQRNEIVIQGIEAGQVCGFMNNSRLLGTKKPPTMVSFATGVIITYMGASSPKFIFEKVTGNMYHKVILFKGDLDAIMELLNNREKFSKRLCGKIKTTKQKKSIPKLVEELKTSKEKIEELEAMIRKLKK